MAARTILVPAVLLTALALAGNGRAQQPSPRPFPVPGASTPAAPAPPPRPSPPPAQPATQAPAPAARLPVDPQTAPTEEALGLPIYPEARYMTSYDAGRGQRYYLFGTTTDFATVVAYYRGILKTRGDLVFEEPPTHMFEVGRFREETMAFPPGVTIKDFTWGGSPGFPNPKRGVEPARFATVIQLVPAPPAAAPPGGR